MASALCLLGRRNSDESSFIDVAAVVTQYSSRPDADLRQLYRRLVFSAAINNTDNHLRNHSFILGQDGWRLSPAYDMNPSIHGRDSVLAIEDGVHSFSSDAIRATSLFYNLEDDEAERIIDEVIDAVSSWRVHARRLGLSGEIPLMESAFGMF